MLIASLKSPVSKIPDAVDAVELRLDLNPALQEVKTTKPIIIKSSNPYDAHLGEFFDCDWQNTPPKNTKIICSRHMDHTPENLESIYEDMQKAMPHAHIYKLATTAHSTLDALRMLITARSLPFKAIGLCMGELGQITRILSPITYAHLGEATAPGQLSVSELTNIYHFPRNDHAWYGLIGDPINQSPSHITHNPHLTFVKMRITKEELPQFFPLAEKLPFKGLAITIPHKEYFGPPINTLVRTSTGWDQHNTDGLGAMDVLKNVSSKRIAILGAGGAAKAIAEAAIQKGAKIQVYNRSPKNILCKPTKSLTSIEPYDILINATSCGMLSTECPIKKRFILPKTTIMETICNPEETTLLKHAKAKNCHVIYGKALFIAQANRQFKLWSCKTALHSP